MEDTLCWIRELYERNFVRMHNIGRTFIFQRNYGALENNAVEDLIHDVFEMLINDAEILKTHANIDGWLTITLKHKLMDYNKHSLVRFNNEVFPDKHAEWYEFVDTRRTYRSEDALLDRLITEEHMRQLEKLLGKEDMKFFYEYCLEHTPANEIAKRYNMSTNAVYARANRLRRKILNHPEIFALVILLFFC